MMSDLAALFTPEPTPEERRALDMAQQALREGRAIFKIDLQPDSEPVITLEWADPSTGLH